mmetsp:Transcript_54003/g.101301  ORF Transcript_54003/g.101301 Transcript_54003/m.101301 type:complete len:182 (-) Transcript_54003:39-584(-)
MPVSLEVAMVSGRSTTLNVEADTSVDDLRHAAQESLDVGKGSLLSAAGDLLRGPTTVHQAGLRSGDRLMYNIRPCQKVECKGGQAAAEIQGDGSVKTWGYGRGVENFFAVKDELFNVQELQVCDSAFAALRGDGRVFTWGNPNCGGDSSAVQAQLTDVHHIQALEAGFVAVLAGGQEVKWP